MILLTKKTTNWIILLIFLLSQHSIIQAQGDSCKVELSTDLVSRFVWRGMGISRTPAIQPAFKVSKDGFGIQTWASYTIGEEDFQEIDIVLDYQWKKVTLTFADYYLINETNKTSNNYFEWDANKTTHQLEGMVSYNEIAGTSLGLDMATIVYGMDLDTSGNNHYSTYTELHSSHTLNRITLEPFVGFALNKSIYADNPSLVNIGLAASKSISINQHYSISYRVSFIVNPDKGDAWVVFAAEL